MADSKRTRLIHRPGLGFICSTCDRTFLGRREGVAHIARCEGADNSSDQQGENGLNGSSASIEEQAEQDVLPSDNGDQGPGHADSPDVGDLGSDAHGEFPNENGHTNHGAGLGGKAPFLDKVHEQVPAYAEAKCVDGDEEDLRYRPEAEGSPTFPWPNLTSLLINLWAILTRPSRQSLQMLLDLLRYQDSSGNRFDPADVPRSSEHLVSRGRQLLPLLKVLQRKISDKEGNEADAVDIPFTLLLQRMLDSPAVVEEMLSNFGGHVMSSEERHRNRVPQDHITPQATSNVDGARETFMNGDILRASSHMSLECLSTSTGFRVVVGDTVLARVSPGAAAPVPCRLAAAYWQKKHGDGRRKLQLAGRGRLEPLRFSPEPETGDTEEDEEAESREGEQEDEGEDEQEGDEEDGEVEGPEEEVLVVKLNRLVLLRDMPSSFKGKKRRRAETGYESVWEKTNDAVHVRAHALTGPCRVIPAGADPSAAAPVAGADPMPTFVGEGFVKYASEFSVVEVQRAPWRREGLEGWYSNRRAPDSFENVDDDPVFSTGVVLSTDGFNYWSLGGKTFNVDATYVALSCLSPALLRRLRSWLLVAAGAKGRWEEELGPLISSLRQLERGCRARVQAKDVGTMTAFVRIGLLTIMVDSPFHKAMTNTKGSASTTRFPCSTCEVTQEELSDSRFDFSSRLRTPEGIDDSLKYVQAGSTATEKANRSRDRGVVVPDTPNPLANITFDKVRQIGVDILHQDAINKARRMLRFFLDALNDSGTKLVAGRLKAPSLIPPNAEPLGDITSEGGWTGLTGHQTWLVASIAPLLFGPIFASAQSMTDHVKPSEIKRAADRQNLDLTLGRGKSRLCQAFRDLLTAISTTTFMVRAKSFTEAECRVLLKWERAQVKQAWIVAGEALGTLHKGMHIPDNIRDLGMVSNTNTAESKHKQHKKGAASSDGRGNLVHIWRTYNDTIAVKSLADDVVWTARAFVKGKWVVKDDCRAGPVTREVLRDLVKVLPLEPASASDGAAALGRGHPHGYKEWEAVLNDRGGGSAKGDSDWEDRVCRTLPSRAALEEQYDAILGCGREEDDPPCSSPTCSFCWRNRGLGLFHNTVCCFNHWGQAPEAASAGTGKIRGVAVQDACSDPSAWMLSRSRGNDLEIYVSADAARDGTTGVEHTTLGRVVYFFEHQGNNQRRNGKDFFEEGVYTVWVAVLEYVTAGSGRQRKRDACTGLDVFHIRSTLTFYPASAIRRVVHMMHQCPTSGAGACGLVRDGSRKPAWRCKLNKQSSFLLNKFFHSIGRDPFA